MPLCERMLGTLQCAKRLYEDPFAFRTIRDYTTDDPMKAINWKASAKTGTLMVNTFDSALSQKAMLFLDVEDSGILKYQDLVEESISIAASLARRLLRRGIEVGFCFNGSTAAGQESGFAPTNKKEMLIRMERMLAEYQTVNGAHPFGAELNKYSVPADTLLIFITKNLSLALFDAIKRRAGESHELLYAGLRIKIKPPESQRLRKAHHFLRCIYFNSNSSVGMPKACSLALRIFS